MKKFILQLLLCSLLVVGFSFVARAELEGDFNIIEDHVGIFTLEESNFLKDEIIPIEAEVDARIFIFIDNANEIDTVENASNFLANKIGENENGMVLYWDINQQKLTIVTSGSMNNYLDNDIITEIIAVIEPQMFEGNYMQGVQMFLQNISREVKEETTKENSEVVTTEVNADSSNEIPGAKFIMSFALAITLNVFLISPVLFLFIVFKHRLTFKRVKYSFRKNSSVRTLSNNDR